MDRHETKAFLWLRSLLYGIFGSLVIKIPLISAFCDVLNRFDLLNWSLYVVDFGVDKLNIGMTRVVLCNRSLLYFCCLQEFVEASFFSFFFCFGDTYYRNNFNYLCIMHVGCSFHVNAKI